MLDASYSQAECRDFAASSDLVGKSALSSRLAVQICVSTAHSFWLKLLATFQLLAQTACNISAFGSNCLPQYSFCLKLLATIQILAQTACDNTAFGSKLLATINGAGAYLSPKW